VKYAWRPQEENDNNSYRWHIAPKTIAAYLNSFKQMSVVHTGDVVK